MFYITYTFLFCMVTQLCVPLLYNLGIEWNEVSPRSSPQSYFLIAINYVADEKQFLK